MTIKSGRGWRLAPSLAALEDEANRVAPRRSTASDGSADRREHVEPVGVSGRVEEGVT